MIICQKLNIDMQLLPKVYESPEVTGYISNWAEKETGLKTGIPVAGGGGDNAAAAIGTGVCKNNTAFTTIGTSGVVYAHTDKPIIDKAGRVHTFCCAVPDCWHVMGVTQAAGLSLNWFRNGFIRDLSYKEIDEKCKEIPIGAEKLIYLPYLMGERTPLLNPKARGVFFGLSAIHKSEHMARAVMEGVSYSLLSCLDVLGEMEINADDMAICGGGKSGFWKQMLADVYGTTIKTKMSEEGPALGAAILAGCACGVYKSVEEGCEICVRDKERILPHKENHKEYMKYYEIYKELYPALKNSFEGLAKIL